MPRGANLTPLVYCRRAQVRWKAITPESLATANAPEYRKDNIQSVPLPQSTYSASFLLSASMLSASTCIPVCADRRPLARIGYNDVLGSKSKQLDWLSALFEDGACLVTGGPSEPGTVTTLCNIVSEPQHTIYGTTFQVVTEATPINVAYSSVGLELHQDLVYYESPPGLQMLHCIDFASDVAGGESTLMDGFALLERFRAKHPREFCSLCTIPAVWKKVGAILFEWWLTTYGTQIYSKFRWVIDEF